MNLLKAVENEPLDKFEIILSGYKNTTNIEWLEYLVLCKSLEIGRKDLAQLLLNRNCNVNLAPEVPSSTPLHYAVKLGEPSIVQLLLVKRASITSVDSDGNTPLHLAFLQNDKFIVDRLIQSIKGTANHDNKKNQYNLSHLHIACTRPYSEDVIIGYLNNGAEIADAVDSNSSRWAGYTALHFAAKYKSSESLKILMDYAEEHDDAFDQSKFRASRDVTPLDLVNRQLNSLQDMLCRLNNRANFNESTALHCAVKKGLKANVKVLLKQAVEIETFDEQLSTPLHLALYRETPEDRDDLNSIVNILFRALKRKIDQEDHWDNHRDENGLSYLHIAATRNDIEMAEKFLDENNVNDEVRLNSQAFSYFTPLHFAVKYGHREMTKFLIDKGADVNKDSADGTALHIACELGYFEIIDLLLQSNVNVKVVRKSDDTTPLHALYCYYDNITSTEEKKAIMNYMSLLK